MGPRIGQKLALAPKGHPEAARGPSGGLLGPFGDQFWVTFGTCFGAYRHHVGAIWHHFASLWGPNGTIVAPLVAPWAPIWSQRPKALSPGVQKTENLPPQGVHFRAKNDKKRLTANCKSMHFV